MIKAELSMSEPIASETQELAVFSTTDIPMVYKAIKGKHHSLYIPLWLTFGLLIQKRGVEDNAISNKPTKVGLILSPKYYVNFYYPYKQ